MRVIRILGIVLLIALLLVVALVLALRFVDINHYWGFIENRIEAATDRDLIVDGSVKLDASMTPVIIAENVRMANLPGGSEPDMIHVGRLEAQVDLVPLLRGIFEVKRIQLSDTRIVLERDAAGRGNWQFSERTSRRRDRTTPKLELRDVQLRNVEVLWAGTSAQSVVSRIDQGSLALSSLAADINLDLNGSMNDVPLTAKGRLGGLWAMAVGRAGDVDMLITAGSAGEQGTVTLQGAVPPPGSGSEVALDLNVDNFDPTVISAFAPVRLSQLGRLNGRASLEGPFDALDLRQVDLTTTSDDLVATVRGTASDLGGAADIDVIADISRANPANLLPDLADRIPADAEAVGSLRLIGPAKRLRAEAISARLNFADTTIDLNGQVGNLREVKDVDLGLVVNASSLASLSRFAGRELPPFGPLRGTARLRGARPDFRIEDLHVALTDPKIDALVRGSVRNVNGPSGVDVEVRLETSELELTELLFKRTMPGAGRLILTADVVDSGGRWVASNIEGNLRSGDLDVALTGEVTDLAKGEGLVLEVDASVASLDSLSGLAGISLPGLQQVELTGELEGGLSKLDLVVDDLRIADQRIALTGQGRIDNLLTQDRMIDLDVEANSSELPELGQLFGATIPAMPGPLSTRGRLVSRDGRLVFEGSDSEVTSEHFNVRTLGSIGDVLGLAEVDLEVTASARQVSDLPIQLDVLPADTGPVDFRGRIGGRLAALAVHEFMVESIQDGLEINVSGDVPDLTVPQNTRLRVSLNADNLTRLNTLAKRELPSAGPVRISTTLQGADGRWSIDDLDVVIDDARLRTEIKGGVSDIQTMADVNLKVDIDAARAADAAAVFGVDVPIVEPLRMSGQVRQIADVIHVSQFNVRLGPSTMIAELELAGFDGTEGGRRVAGTIRAEEIDLISMFGRKTSAERRLERAERSRVFSTDPLPLAWFNDVDADVDLAIGRLITQSIVARDLRTRVEIRERSLRMSPLTARVFEGDTTVDLFVDAAVSPVSVDFSLNANGVNPGAVKAIRDDSPIESGSADIALRLEGRGISPAGIASTANGSLLLEVSDLKISGTALETIGADISLNFLRTINPFLAREDNMTFECGIVQADIVDGIFSSRNTLAAQSKRLALVGSGVVELGSEDLEFAISPRPRKGLGLSASNLARIVRIGGKLSSPGIEADPAGLLKSGAKIGAALYTGGLSVLAEGLMNRLQATDNVCDVVRRTLRERLGGSPDQAQEPAAPAR